MWKVIRLSTVLTVSLCLPLASAAEVVEGQEAKSLRWTLTDMRIVHVLLHEYSSDGQETLPPSDDKFVELDSIPAFRRQNYKKRLPDEDAWGRAFHYWSDGNGYVLHSKGPDGVADFDLGPVDLGGLEERLQRYGHGHDDILFSDGRLLFGPETAEDQSRRAMADLRSIGTAIESYSIDHNVYPGPSPGLTEVDFFLEELSPTYIRTLPLLDPWGRPYLVRSDPGAYMLISRGSDGLIDMDYELTDEGVPGVVGGTKEPWRDLVFANGQFVQWFEGLQR